MKSLIIHTFALFNFIRLLSWRAAEFNLPFGLWNASIKTDFVRRLASSNSQKSSLGTEFFPEKPTSDPPLRCEKRPIQQKRTLYFSWHTT